MEHDVLGHAKIADLTDKEANSTAEEMIAYLQSEERFAIIRKEKVPSRLSVC